MASALAIPEVINNFNVYKGGDILIGTSGEITLPDFEAITETISGAGILGEYETSVLGQYSSMEQEVSFRTLDDEIFELMDPTELVNLTFRASVQSTVRSTAKLEYKGMRIIMRGKLKKFSGGTLSQGKQMGASATLELLYIKIEIDSVTKLELDKLNSVFVVNGKDILSEVRGQC